MNGIKKGINMDNITREIKHQYNILEELHGSSSRDELIRIVSNIFKISIFDVRDAMNFENEVPDTPEYGLVLGRFQPFHYGHQHIINEILIDGRIPLIALGNDYGRDKVRNPLSIEQRKTLIKLIYPNTPIIFITANDNDNWTDWFDSLGHNIIGDSGRHVDQIVMYYNNKEADRYDHFECNGKEYINEFYTKIFEDNDIRTKKVEFVERNDIVVDADATNIRDNLEAYKHLLDGRVYWQLKKWGW